MSTVVSISEGLPPADLVVAALEDAIVRIESTLRTLKAQPAQGEPDAAQEAAYFRRQLNAYNRAMHYFLTGVRPVYAGRDVWLIPSGSRAGAVVHRVTRQGGVWLCGPTCEAAAKGIVHWHNALLSAIEVAWELAELQDDGDECPACGGGGCSDCDGVQYDNIPYPRGIGNPDPDEGNQALAALQAEREYEYELAA